MTLRILVLGTKVVDFENKENEKVAGVRVHYALEPGDGSDDSRGYTPAQAFLKGTGAKDLIKAVPGYYQGQFDLKTNAKEGRTDLKLVGLAFDCPANITAAQVAKV